MVTFKGGSIKSTSISDVKIYSLSGQQNPAAWLGKKKLNSLRKDKDYQKRVELIQDLRFETSTSKIKATPDGEFLIASGIYPPQVKVFELSQYSLKFERHLVSEIVDFQVLADDYSKIAFLCADRSVCLHAKYGSHYSLRIPRMGRDMAYDCWSCDLLCAASSPDVYRINLEQGRFLPSLNTQSPGINVVSRSTVHGLVACGGDDGAVECFDMRKKSSVGRTNAVVATGDVDQEITALQFEELNGYLMAVGNSAGKISIYDLRMSDPIRVKDHMYGSAISSIKWHQTLNSVEPKLISADSHIVRIWDPNTGDNMTSIEPTGNINDICVFPESGLMFLAMDGSQIPAYFVPALGPAPKWCTHLENLTEEMEEKSESTIYDHYKFLTREDLERLNLTSAIGTNLLRAYMHGFFVDYRLYKKAQSILNPFAYDEYLKKRKEEKMEAERASRITIKAKLPKVNRQLAARLLENEEAEEEETNADDIATKKKSSKKNKGLSSTILKDERFKDLFENKEYELDEFSAEYRQLHPLATKRKPSLLEEHFEPVTEDGEQNTDESDSEPQQSDSTRPRNSKRPRLFEIKDERHADAFWSGVSLGDEDALPLGERVSAMEEKRAARTRTTNVVKMGPGGSREISFIPRGSGRRKNEEPWEGGSGRRKNEEPWEGGSGRRKNEEPWEGKRRGVQSLGLKPDKAEFYSSGRGGRGRGGRGGRGRSRGRGHR